MLTALHRLFKTLPANQHALDYILPRVTRELQQDFIHWVDGGAGIGMTSAHYASILAAELTQPSSARVYCYDPLPDNFQVMKNDLGGRLPYVLRDVALSNEAGNATFVIPSRVKDDTAGKWAQGTSWGGSLKFPVNDRETVTVKTVRLADEAIPRFDFVKLDLQGGELDALQGMGDRIGEAKLLYVETQILNNWQNSLEYLHERGFLTFYDRLQFGFKPGTNSMPLALFKELGIAIDRISLPQSSGMPLICWGHFDADTGAIDPRTYVLKTEVAKRMSDAGVLYIQTDAIAINAKFWRKIAPMLMPD